VEGDFGKEKQGRVSGGIVQKGKGKEKKPGESPPSEGKKGKAEITGGEKRNVLTRGILPKRGCFKVGKERGKIRAKERERRTERKKGVNKRGKKERSSLAGQRQWKISNIRQKGKKLGVGGGVEG